MSKNKDIFIEDSEIASDLNHRKTINFNIGRYNAAVKKGKLRYVNMDLARQRASFVKEKAISNLADQLMKFEKNALENGIEVIWARDGGEAVSEIVRVMNEVGAEMIVKSKSMISEEIELNENLEKEGIEPVETDLGEFIVQVAGEKPYHILTPAMHKSKEEVARLFNNEFGTPPDATPEDLTAFVRERLRRKFTTAAVGITGANFLVADVGGVALTENEGNGLMSVSFPKTHIVIAGIEKIIPSVEDLPLMLPLLSTMGTGQQVTAYNSLFTGPKSDGERDGPERMVVVLIDNRRTELAKQKEHYLSLKCIRCGACLNECPIYKNVGGFTFNTTYSGPVGSVITPYLKGFKAFNHLSYACTVCGACTDVCPVKIPLHELLLLNRKRGVEEGLESFSWNAGIKAYEWAFRKRKNLDRVNGKVKNLLVKTHPNILGKEKEFPSFAKRSFSRSWKLNLK